MKIDKEVFTTFEVAKICNANITSIKNWIDKGDLKAFRTPGGHYRIERKILDKFLVRHGMPNPFAEQRKKRVLVVQKDRALLEEIEAELGEGHDYDWTDDAVDAVLKIGQWKPDAAVLDAQMKSLDVAGLCGRVREHQDLSGVKLVVIYGEADGVSEEEIREAGADVVIKRGEGSGDLIAAVRDIVL